MEEPADKQLSIKGRNFNGSFKLSEGSLALNLSQFKKGQTFNFEISNQTIAKEQRKYFIFKKVDDLLYELTRNEAMEISDENNLMIPVPFTYREKIYEFLFELPLKSDKFKGQVESCQNVLEKIQKSLNQKQKQKFNSLPEIIFHGDPTNKNLFRIDTKAKTVKFLGEKYQSYIFNSSEALPKAQACYFEFKITKTAKNNIWFGICGKWIKSEPNPQYSVDFMGYCLSDGRLYAGGLRFAAVANPKQEVGQSKIKVYIDTKDKKLGWIMNNTLLHSAPFCEGLKYGQLYPFVSLRDPGDTVEILSM